MPPTPDEGRDSRYLSVTVLILPLGYVCFAAKNGQRGNAAVAGTTRDLSRYAKRLDCAAD
jgi:hypothetical protein